MNRIATTAALMLAATAAGSPVAFDNADGAFVWERSFDPDGMGSHLRVDLPPEQEGGFDINGLIYQFEIGDATPHFDKHLIENAWDAQATARVVRDLQPTVIIDEDGYETFHYFATVLSPGDTVGPGMNYADSAAMAVENYYADPWRFVTLGQTAYVGVSILLGDGTHYGWVRLGVLGENLPTKFQGYTPLAWGYETLPGVPITIPADGLPWIRQFGSTDHENASDLAPDGVGGVFVSGHTYGSLGGPNAGGVDAYLARYNDAGEEAWIVQLGTGAADSPAAVAPHDAGGVFMAGTTAGSLGGPSAGGYDAFLARYDGAGGEVWVVQFGTSEDDFASALAPDGEGGSFIAGYTGGSLGGPNAGGYDPFLARYDGSGSLLWIVQFGGLDLDVSGALAPDGEGGVFLAGYTDGSLGGPGAGGRDAFLARYDGDGNQLWLTQFGTSEYDFASALAPDWAGGVFLAGSTRGDLGGPNAGVDDVFLTRYDSAGNQAWATQFGTEIHEFAYGLARGGGGGVFVAGWTYGDLGGPNAGANDAFIARHDNNGTQGWVMQFGTSYDDQAYALASDELGGVYVAGDTSGSLGGPNAGSVDAFIARFGVICYADIDQSGTLDLFDFLFFVNLFDAGFYQADCDASGGLDLFDFLCFTNAFNAGC